MPLRAWLCPPLFLARRREWPAFVLNGAAYAVSLLLIVSGLYQLVAVAAGSAADTSAGVAVGLWAWGFIFWLLCVAHADTRRRARANPSTRKRTRKRRLVKVALFLASYVALFVLAQSCARTMARRVGPEVPAIFPVVVVTPGTGGEKYQAHLVFYRDLPGLVQKYPGHSYLVPRGDEKRLGSRLEGGTFWVEHRADGTQAFEVEKTVPPEAYVVGWYEASEKELRPARFYVFHRMAFSLVAGLPVGLGSLLLTWILLKLLESVRVRLV